MVCGSKLIYQTHSKDITCNYFGKTFVASVFCPEGLYVCDACHGADFYDFLDKTVLTTTSKNPMGIAEFLLQGPFLPSLGADIMLLWWHLCLLPSKTIERSMRQITKHGKRC